MPKIPIKFFGRYNFLSETKCMTSRNRQLP